MESENKNRFLERISRLICENFDNEQFCVEKLAKLYGTSRSQLYKKIKKHTGNSVNRFIKDVRLQKAMDLLEEDENSVSEVAYKVGFHSPAYFATCFKAKYGYSPGEVKHHIYTDEKGDTAPISKNNIVLVGAVILLIVAVIFSLRGMVVSSKDKKPIVAVLPFEDISKDKNNSWFCNGISVDISEKLSKLNGLQVISKTSTSRYKESLMSIPEIAKELKADYFLEGGVREFNNRILINVRLVDAEGVALWSESFNEEMNQLFKIQQEVSTRVAKLLEVSIDPKHSLLLEKVPTGNMEAYKLYLKGKEFNASAMAVNWDFESSIQYLKQAITLDSSFADAYAEMAYAQINKFIHNDKKDSIYLDQSLTNIDRALQLDSNTVIAHVSRAIIEYEIFDQPQKGLESLEKALAIDPNNAIVNFELAWYYGKNDDYIDEKKYLMYINIAAELDPLSRNHRFHKLEALRLNGLLNEAEIYLEKISPIIDELAIIYQKSENVAYRSNDRRQMLTVYMEALQDSVKMSSYQNAVLNQQVGRIYDQVFNNETLAVSYYEKAYALEPSFVYSYFFHLVANGDFEKAWKLSQSKDFKTIGTKQEQLYKLFFYYLFKKDYSQALLIANDSLLASRHDLKATVLAKMGRMEEADKVASYPMGNAYKAFAYAALGRRDSMYYYLGKPNMSWMLFNGYSQYDPYRDEQQFIEIQQQHLLPSQSSLNLSINPIN
ncbi:helix-turn-helix domain-containing protein [Flagellimonas zhangzhouensis]|uniref:TolB amino-terminal domain-containing protein n=1 Tax=Flagellimonas zhangzhouensis TaxID=1073328 RepID=A0A1H2X3P1_9FLAO|nr:helix-turn-helix domain-containing protein [Allomuricauda zhangzhouensis]SDQ27415.1 TolB amino-terminal domain-containing protein [Allomuricauda zhangzhouensis]SDW87104.1 TolB amino-terminal domain-containing protein [Allomuricauda zhangzhouensis]